MTDDDTGRDSKAKRDAAMAEYLGREEPRLRSSQAPGQPVKRFDQPKPPRAAPKPVTPAAPPPVERIVHVGPSFWTIVWAVIVGQVILAVIGAFYWNVVIQPEIESDLQCAVENVDRALAGQQERVC